MDRGPAAGLTPARYARRVRGGGRRLYDRVGVPLEGGVRAWVYVGDPDRLEAPADWPGEDPFADRVRTYIDDEGVRVRRAGNR